MEQLKATCAIVLVLGFSVSVLEGARMRCEDNSECPEDHCCLTVGEDLMCTKLQTLGQFCQPVGEHDANNNQDDHVSTYTGNCPCGQGLVCIDAVSSTSEEDDSSANSGGLGVCQNTEPEKDDDQPAE
ncbi:uncharacterized protein LOC110833168 [Zootermopsis nevadensis]|uniref:uncharacterized protein LOC110833168 n=1 Tax=Zootermopsis nevadensis TaxID=136037 RepID=UPI000B8E7286|nr:uncharacterized protein LOC110833168 [Zootermopsis nevadensis]XP_021926571.1 uncharacterized protein LOC110833168 [Zootermopsis nevadensis]